MSSKYELSDVRIISAEIKNADESARVDIRHLLFSISIFEDIYEPTLYAEIILIDALNLINDFPIIGEEKIEIFFVTPFRDRISKFKFNVFSISGNAVAPSGKASSYILKCVSDEHFLNGVISVNKSYNDTSSNIVKSILKDYLKTEKIIEVEETRGILNLTIPNMSPFAAIDLLKQKSIGIKESGGVYTFFENQYGFNFKSIERMMEDGKTSVESKIFTFQPNTLSDKQRQTYGYRNLLGYEHVGKIDSVSKLQTGAYKSITQTFDITTKNVNEIDFKFVDQGLKIFSSDLKAKIPNSQTFLEKFSTNSGQGNYMNKFFMPKDSSKPNDFVSDMMSYRNSFFSLFNENIIRCHAHGDNFLAVSDVVDLQLPETSGTTEKKLEDKKHSGQYIITRLRHLIFVEEKKFKHRISFDCNKLGHSR